MKTPAFQFYPGDWRKDPELRSVSLTARGLWIELMCLMHESSRRGFLQTKTGNSYTTEQLARMVGTDIQTLEICLTEIEGAGVSAREPSSGILYSKRMKADEELSQKRRAAGEKGGNPRLLKQSSNQKANQPHNQTPNQRHNQIPTPSSSSSSSDVVAPVAADITASVLRETSVAVREFFPNADDGIIHDIARAAWIVADNVQDAEIAEAIRSTARDTQKSPGLWLTTVPDWVKRKRAGTLHVVSRVKPQRQEIDRIPEVRTHA